MNRAHRRAVMFGRVQPTTTNIIQRAIYGEEQLERERPALTPKQRARRRTRNRMARASRRANRG